MDLQVDFPEDVTVLVGENGSGKTNIIDAIRLITAPASGRRFYYFDAERDLTSRIPLGTPITCRQTFSDLTELEKALHIPLLVDEHENLVLTTMFDTNLSRPQRFRITRQVGDAGIAKPEGEGPDRIGYVYLPPLRDAIRELDSSEGNRLAQIIQAVSSDTELDAFLSAGNQALRDLARNEAPARAIQTVQDSLSLITHPSREQMIGLGYREQNAARLARLLRMQMADLGMDLRAPFKTG